MLCAFFFAFCRRQSTQMVEINNDRTVSQITRRERTEDEITYKKPSRSRKNYLECRFFDMKLDFGMKSAVKFITFCRFPLTAKNQQRRRRTTKKYIAKIKINNKCSPFYNGKFIDSETSWKYLSNVERPTTKPHDSKSKIFLRCVARQTERYIRQSSSLMASLETTLLWDPKFLRKKHCCFTVFSSFKWCMEKVSRGVKYALKTVKQYIYPDLISGFLDNKSALASLAIYLPP